MRERYGTIVIVGGGCYGSLYLRQLDRARRAGAIDYARVLAVDRDPACRAARLLAGEDGAPLDAPDARVVASDWSAFFDAFLPDAGDDDAIVPSPLMPHLMYEWLVRRARARWPGRRVESRPLERPPAIPWQRAVPDGTHYVSFAEWTCPINCIEPARCPATRGERTWSLPTAVRAYVEEERSRGRQLAGPAIFHCRHRAYGVGMFGADEVRAADQLVATAAATGDAEVLVGTVSHCHGALCVLSVGG